MSYSCKSRQLSIVFSNTLLGELCSDTSGIVTDFLIDQCQWIALMLSARDHWTYAYYILKYLKTFHICLYGLPRIRKLVTQSIMNLMNGLWYEYTLRGPYHSPDGTVPLMNTIAFGFEVCRSLRN